MQCAHAYPAKSNRISAVLARVLTLFVHKKRGCRGSSFKKTPPSDKVCPLCQIIMLSIQFT